MFFIAGPCLAESWEILETVAIELKRIADIRNVIIIFKASYRKANRTSPNSFAGVGDGLALQWLAEIKNKYQFQILTDIHSATEAKSVSQYVDIIQIPAFLCRQTDILLAAGETGKIVNIKKGQFASPNVIINAAKKVESTGNKNIWITERGTFFGYNDLVVDFRSLKVIKDAGYVTIYDATHSLQKPAISNESGGYPELIPDLARAAVAVGIDGLFFETHPNPNQAASDKETQLPLEKADDFITSMVKLDNFIKNL